jgi:hypothetical protein
MRAARGLLRKNEHASLRGPPRTFQAIGAPSRPKVGGGLVRIAVAPCVVFAIDSGVDNGQCSQAERGCPFRRILPTKEMKQIDVFMHMFATLGYIRSVTYAPVLGSSWKIPNAAVSEPNLFHGYSGLD